MVESGEVLTGVRRWRPQGADALAEELSKRNSCLFDQTSLLKSPRTQRSRTRISMQQHGSFTYIRKTGWEESVQELFGFLLNKIFQIFNSVKYYHISVEINQIDILYSCIIVYIISNFIN